MKSLHDLFNTVDSKSILLVDKISENKQELAAESEGFDVRKLNMIKEALQDGYYPLNMSKINLSLLSNDQINCVF